MKCDFCGTEMDFETLNSAVYGDATVEWFCPHCNKICTETIRKGVTVNAVYRNKVQTK